MNPYSLQKHQEQYPLHTKTLSLPPKKPKTTTNQRNDTQNLFIFVSKTDFSSCRAFIRHRCFVPWLSWQKERRHHRAWTSSSFSCPQSQNPINDRWMVDERENIDKQTDTVQADTHNQRLNTFTAVVSNSPTPDNQNEVVSNYTGHKKNHKRNTQKNTHLFLALLGLLLLLLALGSTASIRLGGSSNQCLRRSRGRDRGQVVSRSVVVFAAILVQFALLDQTLLALSDWACGR